MNEWIIGQCFINLAHLQNQLKAIFIRQIPGLFPWWFWSIRSQVVLPGGSDGKESACIAGDLGSAPESGRYPGEGNGYSLQNSCQENFMDRGAWQATFYGVSKSQTWLSNWTMNNIALFNHISVPWDFPGGSVVKNPSASAGDAGDMGSYPESGRFP